MFRHLILLTFLVSSSFSTEPAMDDGGQTCQLTTEQRLAQLDTIVEKLWRSDFHPKYLIGIGQAKYYVKLWIRYPGMSTIVPELTGLARGMDFLGVTEDDLKEEFTWNSFKKLVLGNVGYESEPREVPIAFIISHEGIMGEAAMMLCYAYGIGPIGTPRKPLGLSYDGVKEATRTKMMEHDGGFHHCHLFESYYGSSGCVRRKIITGPGWRLPAFLADPKVVLNDYWIELLHFFFWETSYSNFYRDVTGLNSEHNLVWFYRHCIVLDSPHSDEKLLAAIKIWCFIPVALNIFDVEVLLWHLDPLTVVFGSSIPPMETEVLKTIKSLEPLGVEMEFFWSSFLKLITDFARGGENLLTLIRDEGGADFFRDVSRLEEHRRLSYVSDRIKWLLAGKPLLNGHPKSFEIYYRYLELK